VYAKRTFHSDIVNELFIWDERLRLCSWSRGY